ncbi:MAG TPA: transcriptional repressor LexA [Planctomycetaceae bacterium]|nr:transcriptional repressor LexA [Planctomycetaceae bacterium]
MARPKSEDLTPRQREAFEWIEAFIAENDMPPTVREIGRALGIKSSSVFALLKAIEEKGYLRRSRLGARSLVVVKRKPHRRARDCRDVPVLGQIAAGRPIEAIEHDRGFVAVRKDLLGGRDAFALRVAGDSMIEAGILDGDYVIVRSQETAENGDIVVALIEDEATLKRFRRIRGGVRLEPANQAMKPIEVKKGAFRIQGKVVGVMRFYEGT